MPRLSTVAKTKIFVSAENVRRVAKTEKAFLSITAAKTEIYVSARGRQKHYINITKNAASVVTPGSRRPLGSGGDRLQSMPVT